MCTTTMTTLGTPKKWPLLTGGRYSEVTWVVKAQYIKLWLLLSGGRYLEMVVNSSLTVIVK